MPDFFENSRYGTVYLVLACALPLLCAIISMFRDREVRYVGILTIIIFAITFIPALGLLDWLEIELPSWMTGRRNLAGKLILLLWGWCSYKVADKCYYRFFC